LLGRWIARKMDCMKWRCEAGTFLEFSWKVSERCPVEDAEGAKEGIEVVGRGDAYIARGQYTR
jgi:hypothetical protein